MTIPMQNISPGHPRFVGGFVLTGNQVNSDGTTTAVVDTTTALVLTSNKAEIVAVIDPSDNRKVIVTANIAPGAAQVTGSVVLNTNPALPINTQQTIPVTVTSAPDRRRLDWSTSNGGTEGDA